MHDLIEPLCRDFAGFENEGVYTSLQGFICTDGDRGTPHRYVYLVAGRHEHAGPKWRLARNRTTGAPSLTRCKAARPTRVGRGPRGARGASTASRLIDETLTRARQVELTVSSSREACKALHGRAAAGRRGACVQTN